uniref:Shisa family member 7a n=1 Tax=Sphaeramia orbicularis TaxID=375764 RepID=A0A673AVY5_9TELE
MTPTTNLRIVAVSLLSLLTVPLTTAVETSPSPPPQHIDHSGRPFTEQPKSAPSSSLLLLSIQANIRPAALQGRTKTPEKLPETAEGVLEAPPRPMPQVMFPKNVTSADALAPPLGAAQVEPIRPRLMDVWMDVCRGYYDVMGHFDSSFNCTKDGFIYCCGTCYLRFCCPDRNRQLEQESCPNYDSPDWAKPQTDTMFIPEDSGNDPDFDPLKQQSHNTGFVIGGVVVFMVVVAVGIKVVFNKVQQEAIQRDLNMPRALVDMLRHQSSPVQQDERNNSVALTVGDGQGTLGRPPKNLYAPGLPSKDNRLCYIQRSKSHLTHSGFLPVVSVERTPRMNNAQLAAGGTLLSSKHNNTKSQPSFHHSLHNLAQLPPSYESATKPELNRYSSLKRLGKYSYFQEHHLHWGGDYTLSGRGTLPRHNSNTQTLTRKTQERQREERQERLLMSPDHLEERMGGMGVVDPYAHTTGGIVPTLPRQQKAQSQQNVCATPSLDRHHMIKMNSHPTSGREQERNTPMTGARRMAFAAKRQNTIEQLHFIPGGGGGGTGSKNEVTV